MARKRTEAIVEALLDLHGRTFAEEIGVKLGRGSPAGLFQLLCASILLSARIRSTNAIQGTKGLIRAGWTTAEKMAGTTWEQRVKVLNENGYARYDERTASMLEDVANLALERYGGDLRELREAAGRDPKRERKLLKEFKGMGEVGASIFLREVQGAWDELYPFADERVLQAAGELRLPKSAEGLAKLVDRRTFPRLVAAVIRTKLENDRDSVLDRAKRAA